MSEVNFNEENLTSPTQNSAPRTPKGLYGIPVQLGLAKDEAGARVILIIVAIIFLGFAILYPFIFG